MAPSLPFGGEMAEMATLAPQVLGTFCICNIAKNSGKVKLVDKKLRKSIGDIEEK
jgi:hypothetical protein